MEYGKTANVEIPFQEEMHLKKWTYVTKAIICLEKEALLLKLIPIAFNKDLESETQIAGLFVKT